MFDNRYWVVFESRTNDKCKWFQRVLHPRYRHCWLLQHDGIGYMRINRHYGLLSVENIYMVGDKMASSVDVLGSLKSEGCELIEVKPTVTDATGPYIAIDNCVNAVKLLLGIHKPFIVTPLQLKKYLMENSYAV